MLGKEPATIRGYDLRAQGKRYGQAEGEGGGVPIEEGVGERG
jgi:hypothetical protein